jgi:hypothetical protein
MESKIAGVQDVDPIISTHSTILLKRQAIQDMYRSSGCELPYTPTFCLIVDSLMS